MQPRIEVGGLTLRPWRESDADAVLKAFSCPEIQRWHVRRMDTRDEAREWIGAWPARWDDETAASWAISHDDEPIGQTGLRHLSLVEASAALSYWVLPEARGAAKLGFAVEGTLRGSGRHADGWHDMHLHARLRTDGTSCRT